MKIAMFADSFFPRINGVSVSMLSFARELVKRGNEVCIVCPNYNTKRNSRHKNLNVKSYSEILEYEGHNIYVFRAASDNIIWSDEDRYAKYTSWHAIKSYLDNFKPDVIHVNSEYVMGRFGSHYAKHRHLPLVYTFHTYWEEYCEQYAKFAPKAISRFYGREISLYLLRRADYIIAPTIRFQELIKNYGFSDNVIVLPTGISSEISIYDDKKATRFFNHIHKLFPVVKKKPILLYVGRVAAEKNLYFLLDMLGEVRKTVKDAVLVIVGDGGELPALKAKASKLPYSWNICFTGYCNRDELAYYYKMADVFVFPSLTETQGLVTLEAMTIGLPVVAIGEMGTLDVMQGDNGGFMVKNDLQEFSQKVIALLQDKELHEQKSKEAVEWSKKWSITETTDKLIAVYEKAINSHLKTKA
ncbi:MAG: glycosyltransferase [Treponema sp.]|nr:glycosyltransferase [Spirochaetia bacterium]MDY2840466.1 glycosyltransferase [Treponema sp.]MDY5122718.1 glycosyltransferase [Treponema sp.]